MTLTYSSYLKLDELLSLQEPQSKPPEHDETLFIVIHQVYELWFALLLHEFEKVQRDFSKNDLFGAIHTFKRCRTVMKTLVGQLDILETMTPMSFTSFRDRLDTASGFQSVQFRELEFLLGYKRPEMVKLLPENAPRLEEARRRLRERSVIDHFYDFLEHYGVAISDTLRARDSQQAHIPNESIQEGILQLYKSRPDVGILFELMTDFDEGFQEWKYRHVKLVERTIGEKHGTGGSLGVEFLKKTLFIPIFHDLWDIRHRL
jgi:tryptophan 2,3-dioxygenase